MPINSSAQQERNTVDTGTLMNQSQLTIIQLTVVPILYGVTPPITLVLIPVMDPNIKHSSSQRSNWSTLNIS